MHVRNCRLTTTLGLPAVQTKLARRGHTQGSLPCPTGVKVPYFGSRISSRQYLRLAIAQASGGAVLCYLCTLMSNARFIKSNFGRNKLLREMASTPNDLSCDWKREVVLLRFAGSRQEDLDFAVFRFTLGIPGFNDDLIPRVVGLLAIALLTANHFAAGSAAGSLALVCVSDSEFMACIVQQVKRIFPKIVDQLCPAASK